MVVLGERCASALAAARTVVLLDRRFVTSTRLPASGPEATATFEGCEAVAQLLLVGLELLQASVIRLELRVESVSELVHRVTARVLHATTGELLRQLSLDRS